MVSTVLDAAAAPRRSSVKETSDATDGVVGSHSVEAKIATDRRAARRRWRWCWGLHGETLTGIYFEKVGICEV